MSTVNSIRLLSISQTSTVFVDMQKNLKNTVCKWMDIFVCSNNKHFLQRLFEKIDNWMSFIWHKCSLVKLMLRHYWVSAFFYSQKTLYEYTYSLFLQKNGVVSKVVFNRTVQNSSSNHFIHMFLLQESRIMKMDPFRDFAILYSLSFVFKSNQSNLFVFHTVYKNCTYCISCVYA